MTCVVCGTRAASVPDRNQSGRPIKRLCRMCHRIRLTGDLRLILSVERLAQIDAGCQCGLYETCDICRRYTNRNPS